MLRKKGNALNVKNITLTDITFDKNINVALKFKLQVTTNLSVPS